MLRSVLLAMSLLAAPGAPAFAQQAGQTAAPAASWTSFTPPEGHYSVLMPGAPQRKEEVTPDGPGKGAKNVLYFLPLAGTIYLVGWSDYPPGVNLDTQGEIDANRDNFLKGLDANLTSSKARSLGSAPGLEFTGEKPGEIFISGRVFLVGRRPFIVVAATHISRAASPDISRFLDSFRLK